MHVWALGLSCETPAAGPPLFVGWAPTFLIFIMLLMCSFFCAFLIVSNSCQFFFFFFLKFSLFFFFFKKKLLFFTFFHFFKLERRERGANPNPKLVSSLGRGGR